MHLLAGLLPLVGVLAPIFALIGLGFGLGRMRVFSPEQVSGLSRFVLLAALPALLLNALARAHMAAIFRLDYLVVYGGASLCALALGIAIFRLGFDEPVPRAAVRALGMANSNSAFVALPIGALVFGAAVAGPIALNMIFENMVLFPLILILIEAGSSGERHVGRVARNVAARLVRTPMLIAIVLGALISLSGLGLPEPALRTLGLLGGATAPLALAVIGLNLAGASLHGKRRAVATIAFGKLVIHPLLVFMVLSFVPISDPVFRSAAILFAAMPMMSIFPVIAERTDDVATASAALLVTTIASFGTLLMILLLLGIQI